MTDLAVIAWAMMGCAIWLANWWNPIREDGWYPFVLFLICLPIAFLLGPIILPVVLFCRWITR